jgi:hypothetical protein
MWGKVKRSLFGFCIWLSFLFESDLWCFEVDKWLLEVYIDF